MPRYISGPAKATQSDEWGATTAQMWFEADDARAPQNTGLLDAGGHPLYRLPEPVGFVRERDNEGRN